MAARVAHYGLIALVRGGSLGAEGYGLAQTFRLTDRPYGNTRATYDFQNWDGVLFETPKHVMTEADKERRKRDRKKPAQNNFPVPTAGTPRPNGRDIEKTGSPSSLCPNGRDIEIDPDRPNGRDVTSLTSYQALKADAAVLKPIELSGVPPPAHTIGHNAGPPLQPEITGLREWTTPTLIELEWNDYWQRYYCKMIEQQDTELNPQVARTA
jgi:hypothetical protein